MADVYIIAARADAARVEPIAKALEARGFGVWYEQAGADRRANTQAAASAMESAKAVIAVWSNASIKVPGVLDEAGRAGDRLVPVMIEPVSPPPAFSHLSPEILNEWPAVRALGPFERLVLTLESRTAKAALPASAVPQEVIAAAARANKQISGRKQLVSTFSWVAGLLAVTAIGVGVWQNRDVLNGLTPPTVSPPTAQDCGPVQKFCLTEEQLKTASEGELVAAVLEKSSLEDLIAGAGENDALSSGLLCLGQALGSGDAMAKDPEAAAATCKAASELGSPLGRIGLAALFDDGAPPTPKDPAAARALLASAAADGDARAQYLLALRDHQAKNFTAAQTALKQCAPSAYTPCLYLRAFMLENGQGEPADVVEAVRLYTPLTEAAPPYVPALQSLAWIMQNGAAPEIAPDLAKAALLYRRGMEMNDGYSAFQLGEMARNGQIPGEGRAQAVTYFQRAAALGYGPASEALAQ